MKKVLCIFITLALCFTMFGAAAAAAESKISCTVTYKSGYTYVKLACSGANIYYTTDGTAPTRNSALYSGRFKVTKPTQVRAAAYSGSSKVASRTISVGVRTTKPVITYLGVSSDGKSYEYRVDTAGECKIYFTTDGTTPSAKNGSVKSGLDSYKIKVNPGAVLKVCAKKTGYKYSTVAKADAPGESPAKSEESLLEEYRARVLELVNEARAAEGVGKLTTEEKLTKSAQKRAEELETLFSHTRPDGSSCFTMLDEFDVTYWSAGENIAAGYSSPESVVEGWLNSPGHRKNILNPNFSKLGVGVAFSENGYGIYWSQVFIG
ncbi:MAG: CAP domain-containing protein [Oscillospiraceae bacterium]